ncbi:MAG: tRNA (adenosine(37)-N6)-dimethylallyltransferase MiaA [Lachnospiraceae bacterium]|nr:tRNA (adenosine(37)-N6)-dimethylallyltransferase MiaA [Lachnospiraceae bacterium]
MKKPLVIIAGPTATGKTKVSIELAKRINGAVISSDSMQVYKGMDIGSAKITKEEMDGVDHYLIDELKPSDDFNVKIFKDMAEASLKKIYEKNQIPMIVGGTGFYIQALLYGVEFPDEEADSLYRAELTGLYEEKGADYLHEMLRKVDPAAADEINKNNVKRVIRALEFFHDNNAPISEHNKIMRERDAIYNNAFFVLTDDRDKLYERIDKRVDKMLEDGLVDEVKALKEQGYVRTDVAMQGLGYKEILDYLDGKLTLEEAVYIIKRDTRHFAKRQITWFKREKDVIRIDRSEYKDVNAIVDKMVDIIKEREIIG